jgi:hypothetical protein
VVGQGATWFDSAMNVDDCAAFFVDDAMPVVTHIGIGPLEEPGCITRRKIDTAVTSDSTKLVVPVGSMKREPLVKVLNEGYVEQTIGVRHIVRSVHRR